MFKDKKEIEKIVNDFCDEKNILSSKFEVSSISKATGGESKRVQNLTNVINKECDYVIKYYSKLNIFIIWNYRINKAMNYNVDTIKEKLNKGIRSADKGTGTHTKKQYYIYFDYGDKLYELLNLVIQSL